MRNIFRERQFNKRLKRVYDIWNNAIDVCNWCIQSDQDVRIINDLKVALRELTDAVMQSLNALIKMYPEKRDVVEEIKKYIHTENSYFISEEN